MLTDTHTHLYLPDYPEGGNEVVRRAMEAGVERLIFPNVDLATIAPMKALHDEFPQNTYMAMGLHPTEVGENWQADLSVIEEEVKKNRGQYIAIGEIGMDLYWDKSFAAQQREVFSRQIDLAVEENLPVIIHCREALPEVIEILSQKKVLPKGVFHSFGGTVEDVRKIRQTGDFYFGINGIVTFKNSGLKTVLPEIGLDRIVLETDSPYLAPVPKRGRRNESAYLVHIAAAVAEGMGVSFEDVADRTSDNSCELFGFGQ